MAELRPITKDEEQWVIRMDALVAATGSSSVEKNPWERQSIYRLPMSLAAVHPKAYEPHMVSLGPYHHGKSHLARMEQHKRRALGHFLKRAKDKGKTPFHIWVKMSNVVQELKDSYEGLEERWNEGNDFLEMMIGDGCFILEVLRVGAMKDPSPQDTGYKSNDPVFSAHGNIYVKPLLRRNMLMLENQLPMLALTTLTEAAGGKINDLSAHLRSFYDLASDLSCSSLHILHAYLGAKTFEGDYAYTVEDITWSATELREGGVQFETAGDKSFKNVSFVNGILMIPRIDVDDSTETILLNLMAFEHLHVDAGNVVTSYVCLMDTLIDTAKDVELLRRKKIVQGWVGSDDNVASLFNRISKEACVDTGITTESVNKRVNKYRSKKIHKWRASFRLTYFRNPWVFLSLVGALLLLGLAIIQSVYTVLQYYQKSS